MTTMMVIMGGRTMLTSQTRDYPAIPHMQRGNITMKERMWNMRMETKRDRSVNTNYKSLTFKRNICYFPNTLLVRLLVV